jgi:hypothetical protein
MNYKQNYKKIIKNAIKRKKSYNVNINYNDYEYHHIIPRSLGGGYENNMIYLTPREHYIAHYLLMKITKREEMIKAFNFMSKGLGIAGYSSRQYERRRKDDKEKTKLIHNERGKSFGMVIYRYFNDITKTERQLKNIELIFYILLNNYSCNIDRFKREGVLEECNMLLGRKFLEITSGKRISHDGSENSWHNEVIINEKFREILKKIINKTSKDEYMNKCNEYF